eukprot:m.165376 g.165376  ORF g.165376 m.165376 type:complete len:256 (-) comp12554_c0_seq1:262-1029(-)
MADMDPTESGSFTDFELVDHNDGRDSPTSVADADVKAVPGDGDGVADTTTEEGNVAEEEACCQGAVCRRPESEVPRKTVYQVFKALIYYENPLTTSCVICLLGLLYVLLEEGYTLLGLACKVAYFALISEFGRECVRTLRPDAPGLDSHVFAEPAAALADALTHLAVHEDDAVAAVRHVYATLLPAIKDTVLDMCNCTSLKQKLKRVLVAWTLGIIANNVPLYRLFFRGISYAFTVPMIYQIFQANVSPALKKTQ